MSYDQELAARVRQSLPAGARERRMFGGVGFIVSGHLSVALMGKGLLVRVGREAVDELSRLPHAAAAKMGRRTMTGWLFVEPAGLTSEEELSVWTKRGLDFVATLPPKH